MFSCEICKTFKNTYFHRTFPVAASDFSGNLQIFRRAFFILFTSSCIFLIFSNISVKMLESNPLHNKKNKKQKKTVWKYHLIFFFCNFKIGFFVSDVLYKRSRTLVNLKVLNANLGGFSFSQISGLILSDFERNNYLTSHLKSSKVHSFLKGIECFCIIFLQNTPS